MCFSEGRKDINLSSDAQAQFAAQVFTETHDDPTLVLLEAQDWRNRDVLPQFANGKTLQKNQLDLSHVKTFERLYSQGDLPNSRIIRVRTIGSGETPQYFAVHEDEDDQTKEDKDLGRLTGFIDTQAESDFFHYLSVGPLPTTAARKQREKPGLYKTDQGGGIAFKHQTIVGLVPFFLQKNARHLFLSYRKRSALIMRRMNGNLYVRAKAKRTGSRRRVETSLSERRNEEMGESSFMSHEEYELMKVPLERSEVPADALAALTDWIERERLLVDDREDVGGISFSRMDAKAVAPLPHIIASFFAHRPYKRKAGHYPQWNGFYLLLYRDVEEGWKSVQIRKNSSYAEFIPIFAARSKAVQEINKRFNNDREDTEET